MSARAGDDAAALARRELRRARADLERCARAATLADQAVYAAQRRVKLWEYAAKNAAVAPTLASVTGSDARAVTIGDAGAHDDTHRAVGQASRSGSGGVTPGDPR